MGHMPSAASPPPLPLGNKGPALPTFPLACAHLSSPPDPAGRKGVIDTQLLPLPLSPLQSQQGDKGSSALNPCPMPSPTSSSRYNTLGHDPCEWTLEQDRPCNGERMLLMFDRYRGWGGGMQRGAHAAHV